MVVVFVVFFRIVRHDSTESRPSFPAPGTCFFQLIPWELIEISRITADVGRPRTLSEADGDDGSRKKECGKEQTGEREQREGREYGKNYREGDTEEEREVQEA